MPIARQPAVQPEGRRGQHQQATQNHAEKLQGFDAVMLAHFSMAPALPEVAGSLNCPAFSSPQAAVEAMRELLAG